jgi:hypothetical protein
LADNYTSEEILPSPPVWPKIELFAPAGYPQGLLLELAVRDWITVPLERSKLGSRSPNFSSTLFKTLAEPAYRFLAKFSNQRGALCLSHTPRCCLFLAPFHLDRRPGASHSREPKYVVMWNQLHS